MARSKLPDPLAKRHLLEARLDAGKARALADEYLALGREIEAIDFLVQAGATEAIEALEQAALERGDVFLMKKVALAFGRDPSPERWRALSDAATRAGRARDAETAARLATVDA
ncbi:MAG: hypothetical protein R3F35_03480 [Myxococcota bacterium]